MRRHLPWQGDNYLEGLRNGYKTLIFGESHYESDLGEELTRSAVQSIGIDSPYKFFENIRVVAAGVQAPLEPIEFWHRVAFANQVQRVMPTPSDRPTHEDFEDGRIAARQTIMSLKPDIILCFSATSYDYYMPAELGFGEGSRPIPEVDVFWAYPFEDGGKVLMVRFNHASRLAVARDTWRVFCESAFELRASLA